MIDPGELNKWILLQKQDPDSEEWADVAHLRARVNKTNGGRTFDAGADQHPYQLDFDVRYSPRVRALVFEPHPYRIVYAGHHFKVTDTDDYMEQHAYIRIRGQLYE